jgi:hypothetical protein
MAIGRRIVTGSGQDGRSCVLRIDPADIEHGRYVYWHTDQMPVRLARPDQVDATILGLLPPLSGSTFQLIELPPIPEDMDNSMLEPLYAERFAHLGAKDCRGDIARHPGMHLTPTLDYVMLIKGRVTLILAQEEIELSPFDVVIQRNTDHAWANRSGEVAYLLAATLDARGGQSE